MKDNRNSKDRRTFTGVMALSLALVLLIGAGTWWFFDYTKDDGLIYPNVFAFDMDLGGKTPEEAAALLHQQTDGTFPVQSLLINLPDTILTLSPAQTGAALDVDALIRQAYDYGRGGNRWENTQAKADAALNTHELDIASCLTLDESAIRQVVENAAARTASTLTQPTATITGETPT